MAEEKEKFLNRWSRLKTENKQPERKDTAADESPAPILPPVDKLTPDGRLPTDDEAEERWHDNENESDDEREEEDEGGRR